MFNIQHRGVASLQHSLPRPSLSLLPSLQFAPCPSPAASCPPALLEKAASLVAPSSARRQRKPPSFACAAAPQEPASSQGPAPQNDLEFEGLLPEEDAQVPGGYDEAMNGQTRLGKAIRSACSELGHLNQLERDILQQAEGLLKQLGVNTSLAGPPVDAGEDLLLDEGLEEDEVGLEEEAEAGSAELSSDKDPKAAAGEGLQTGGASGVQSGVGGNA